VVALLHPALPIALSGPSPTPYVIGVALGFLVGAMGHLMRSTLLIMTGILLIGVSTAVFAFQGPPS
jgi:hypothetical protein